MRGKIVVAAICLLLSSASSALACDLCAIYRSTEATESKPGPFAGVFEQFTRFGTIQVDGDKKANPANQFMDSSITQFIVGYQFSDNFGVQATLPYINRIFRRPEGFDIEHGKSTGIGDASLTGNYRVYERLGTGTVFFWDLNGGMKFPTGESDRIREELVESAPPPGAPESGIHGHDLALGSGSFDPLVGTSAFFGWDRAYVTASVQYAMRTRGAIGYRYANDLAWSFKPGYFPIVGHDMTLGAQFAVTGETKGKDTFRGEQAQDTGITSVFIGPDVSFTYKDMLSANFGADFPVVNDNTSLQLVSDWRLRAAVLWRF